jgi:CHAD domain-containing protein
MLALDAAQSTVRRVNRCWKNLNDETDIEAVHRMRTGINRLRSLLRLVGPVCTWPETHTLEDRLERWQKRWGPVRDLDVLIQHLSGLMLSLDRRSRPSAEAVLDVLRRRRRRLYRTALKATDKKKGKDARQALNEIRELVRRRRHGLKKTDSRAKKEKAKAKSKAKAGTKADPAAIRLLWPGILPLWKKRKARADRAFWGPTLHKFRLGNKRMRHALQLFQPVAPPSQKALLQLVNELHDGLGALHDHEVLIGDVETLAAAHAASPKKYPRLENGDAGALLRALDAERRRIHTHVLALWKRLHTPEVQALLADPAGAKTPPKTPSQNRKEKTDSKSPAKPTRGTTSAPRRTRLRT